MRLRFIIVILILISFFSIGAFSETLLNKESFYGLENQCASMSEFIENGVKVQYKTKINKDTEANKIKNYFKSIELNENSLGKLNFVNKKFNVETDIWNDDLYTYVNISLINTSISYNTLELKNIIKELTDENSEEIQYFFYCKWKIDDANKRNDTKILEEIMSESIFYKADILEVNNGYIGNVILNNSEKINFAISKYNTGTYIIIGTPIIFAAY